MNRKLISRLWNVLKTKLAFGSVVVGILVVASSTARSQLGLDPCCAIISVGLQSISNLLKSVVAQPLSEIQKIQQQGVDFEQQIVYPTAAINQARGLSAWDFGLSFKRRRQLGRL